MASTSFLQDTEGRDEWIFAELLGDDDAPDEYTRDVSTLPLSRTDLDWGEAFTLGGEGSGNFGHAGRPGEVGGSSSEGGASAARDFKGNEGYEWHERPEMEAYAKGLPADEVRAVTDYAGFGYGDINRILRGTYEPDRVNEIVREATPEEIAAYTDKGTFGKREATSYDPDDPTNKVEDGRVIHNVFAKDATGKTVEWSVQRAVPDTKRIKEIEKTGDTINTLIRERGYELPEAIKVNRAAYIPGMSFEDLKAMEGSTIEEKGFTSTMVGNPGNRLDGYVTGGKSESLYKRYADKEGSTAIYTRQDEVGAAMRIEIVLPEGTKVAPVETLRRIDHEYPKIQDPSVYDHPEWLKNDDGTPNGLTAEMFTIRDRSATPTVNTERLHEESQRSEAEILLGSGAQFRVVSVRRGDKRIVPSDSKMKPIDVIDVKLEYVGGGSSEATTHKDLRHDLGGAGSGNFGHAGRPGEVGGSSSEGGGSAIDRKRDEFMALVQLGEAHEAHLNVLRDGLQAAWKTWSEEIANRKKPLKPDGVAAKKLDSYKAVKALEEQFHAEYEGTEVKHVALNQRIKELLKVPPEDRSTVEFVDSDKSLLHESALHPAVSASAKRALAVFRQYDGSGAFVPIKFPADKVAQFREIFGDKTPLKENADGTFEIPATIKLGKSNTGRAYAAMDSVMLGGGDLDNAVFHEMAHHIEMRNGAVREAAVHLREHILADEPREVYKLNTLSSSLGDDEIAVRGKFPDPYTGKLYPHDVATEIVSTGVESYLSDPVAFAKDRPEHFKFIFDVMQGKYRNK